MHLLRWRLSIGQMLQKSYESLVRTYVSFYPSRFKIAHSHFLYKGLHITAIAEKSGVNPTKLGTRKPPLVAIYSRVYPAQILRYLSARAIFQEVSPNVFAHNRHSSILDTGKSVKEAQSRYILHLPRS